MREVCEHAPHNVYEKETKFVSEVDKAYFYGVARLVMQAARSRKPALSSAFLDDETVPEQTYACLEKCLELLGESERELILEYYAADKRKGEHHKELAQRLGISSSALRVRAFNLRERLKKCIDSCLQETQDKVDDANPSKQGRDSV